MIRNDSPLVYAMAVVVALALSGCGGGSMMPGDALKTSPPTATLSPTGEYRAAPVDGEDDYEFFRWGLWGGTLREDAVTCTAIGCPPAGDAIFWAYLNREVDGTLARTVEGERSGTSPTSGSVVWIGGVRAHETQVVHSGATPTTTYSPVEGDSRLEVDLATGTVDVEFTGFDSNRADISWPGLTLDNGEFGGGALARKSREKETV